MRLSRVARTSSFRLTLIYAAIFCASFLVLALVIFVSTVRSMEAQLDETVAGEIAEIRAGTPDGGVAGYRAEIDEMTGRSPDFLYLLQTSDGLLLAGNLPPLPALRGIVETRLTGGRARRVRGQGLVLADGAYLFVGLPADQIARTKTTLIRLFLWALGGTVVVALTGGAVVSVGLLKRVEALSQASRDIANGDLARRITLRGSDDEFDHLAASFNAIFDRIQTLMDGLRQVSNDLAHDLRTPLTRLHQKIELALRGATDGPELRAALEGSLADVQTILDTFSAILRISRIEATARQARFEAVDLTEILRTAIEVYLPMADERQQTIMDAVGPWLVVQGDRALLLQLFANLIENAVLHTPEGSRIEIVTHPRADAVEVIVGDDGPGIPVGERARVFERFVRLDTARSGPGSGLGLSLAAAIASLHGTGIKLGDNRPGLVVAVRLPLAKVTNPQREPQSGGC